MKAVKQALIAAAIAFITVKTFGLAPTFAIFGGAVTGATAVAIVTFTSTFLTSGVGMLMSKGISTNARNFGTKTTVRNSNAPRQIIYGQTEVGGIVAHMEVTGTDNHLLHLIVLLAGHEVESLVAIKINGKKCLVSGNTTTTTIGGQTVFNVNISDFMNTDNANRFTSSGHLIRFSFNDGSQTTADGFARNLIPSTIPTTHKFTDCAYVYMAMVFDADKNPQIPDLKFEVKGKKCFDPRTNATSFTSNPALIIRDYLTNTTYGMKATSAEINDSTSTGGFAAAANICDQDVTLADGSSTEDRYTANGFTDMSASPEGFIQGALSSMAGKISYTNGQFNLFAGSAQTPSLTITDEDLLAPVSLTTKPSTGDLYNTVKAIYVDSATYVGTDAPVYQDSTFLSQDTPTGESSANYVKQLEIQLPFTTSSTTADRLGKIALRTSRQSKIIELMTTLEFMRLQPGDWVYVTNERLSFTLKTFVVLSTNLELTEDDNGVPVAATKLRIQEVEASIFSHAVSEYVAETTEGSDTSTITRAIAAPTNLSASQVALEQFALNFAAVTASWTNSSSDLVDGTEVSYKPSGSSNYINLGVLAKGVSIISIPNVEIGVTYDIRARHKSIYGTFSSFVTTSITTTGTVTASTDIANSNIAISSGNITGIGTGNNTTVANSSVTIDSTTGKLVGIGTADIVVNNGKVTVDSNGKLVGIGTPDVVVNNASVTVDGTTGKLVGIGTADVVVNNNLVTIDADGEIVGIGTTGIIVNNGKVTVDGTGQLVGIGTSGIIVDNDSVTIDSSTGKLVGIGTADVVVNNGKISVDATTGQLQGIGTGNNTVVNNSKITIDNSTGEIQGIGTSSIVVNNSKVTVDSDGKLVGIGTSNIVVDNDNIASSNLVGSGKVFATSLPADGATVGAQFGTNLFDTDGTTNLTANEIKNGNIGVDTNGRLTNTGTGTTVFSNDKITVNSSGVLSGIGTSSVVVNNQKITVDSDGDLVGIGTANVRVNNDKIELNTDGSLNYSGSGTGNPTMNTLTDADNVRSRVKSGLSTDGDVVRTVSKTVGGWGEDISAKTGIPDFSGGSITYQSTIPKTRGGLAEDLSSKTGVIRVENGTFNFDAQLPATRGGTGLSSVSTLQNSNVVTFEVQGGNLFVWSKFATGNFNPSATTYTFTVRWRDGSGSLLTTSTIQLNLDTTNTDFNAPTVSAGSGNSFNSSSDVSGTGTTEQTISVRRGNVTCTVVGRIEVVTGFTFKFGS